MVTMQENHTIVHVLQNLGNAMLVQADRHQLVALQFAAQGFSKLGRKYQEHAEEERGFAQQMFNRVLDLGGQLFLTEQEAADLPETPLEWLKEELEISRLGLKEILPIVQAAADDITTYDILKDYYKDEEEDLYWTEQQLDLIEAIGYQNWLTRQI
ncbi:ferritin-like domain-containing protein [Streptococcus pantholopis]|nr:ferritin-like domain-containing protein [Streptococcus pantholopis]